MSVKIKAALAKLGFEHTMVFCMVIIIYGTVYFNNSYPLLKER
jgi:hypothetical protein